LHGRAAHGRTSGCDQATVIHKPRLLTDYGSSYVAADLADYLEARGIEHVRGAPHHPQVRHKAEIERWHLTLKNRVLLEHYFLPGDLERQIGAFVEYYNNRRSHEWPAAGFVDTRLGLHGFGLECHGA
jgi:transposase InsO family protein